MENLNGTDIDRIIEMAWEDRTTFDAILETFGLNESEVISLMRSNLKPSQILYHKYLYAQMALLQFMQASG